MVNSEDNWNSPIVIPAQGNDIIDYEDTHHNSDQDPILHVWHLLWTHDRSCGPCQAGAQFLFYRSALNNTHEQNNSVAAIPYELEYPSMAANHGKKQFFV